RLAPIMPAIGRRGPAELVYVPVRSAIVDVLREFALESVAGWHAERGHRRAGDGSEIAAIGPVPAAIPPKLVNRSRAYPGARRDEDDVLRRLPRKGIGSRRAEAQGAAGSSRQIPGVPARDIPPQLLDMLIRAAEEDLLESCHREPRGSID